MFTWLGKHWGRSGPVLGHQAILTRSLAAGNLACSTRSSRGSLWGRYHPSTDPKPGGTGFGMMFRLCSQSYWVGWLASARTQAWLLSVSCGKPAETCSESVKLLEYVTFLFFYKKYSKFLHCKGLLLAYRLTFSFFQISRKSIEQNRIFLKVCFSPL